MEIHKNDFKLLAIYWMWFDIKSSHDQLEDQKYDKYLKELVILHFK